MLYCLPSQCVLIRSTLLLHVLVRILSIWACIIVQLFSLFFSMIHVHSHSLLHSYARTPTITHTHTQYLFRTHALCLYLSLTHTRYADDMEGMPNAVMVAYEPLVLWIDPNHVQEGEDPPHQVEVTMMDWIVLEWNGLHCIALYKALKFTVHYTIMKCTLLIHLFSYINSSAFFHSIPLIKSRYSPFTPIYSSLLYLLLHHTASFFTTPSHLILRHHRSYPLSPLSLDRISVKVFSSSLTVLWA